MTAHFMEHTPATPPMSTLRELRAALAAWGPPGDLEKFEEELASVSLDDLQAVRDVITAYRHRVVLRNNPEVVAHMAMSETEFAEVLRRKPERSR